MSCSAKVFPEKVRAEVSSKLAKLKGDEEIPAGMQLSQSMIKSQLKDTTVRITHQRSLPCVLLL